MWVLMVVALFGYPTDRIDMHDFTSQASCEAAKQLVVKAKLDRIADVDPSKMWSVTCTKK